MKQIIHFFTLLGVALSLAACQTAEPEPPSPSVLYSDTFDNFLPDYFFDQGSWLGLQLFDAHPGLAAPLILSDSFGYTLPEPLLPMVFFEGDQEVSYGLSNHYFPGRLVQEGISSGSSLRLDVIQATSQLTLMQLEVTNLASQPQQLRFATQLSPAYQVLTKSEIMLWAVTEGDGAPPVNSAYGVFDLEGGQSATQYLAIMHLHGADAVPMKISPKEATQYMAENQARWEAYLAPYQDLPTERQVLAAKSIQTLINNYRSPAGEFTHGGAYPSYFEGYFNGLWAWDSWKHAVALVAFRPDFAKEQILTMFDFQNEVGMIPDVVYHDTTLDVHNWRNTKPPLAAWAVHAVWETTADTAFVEEMLPQLIRYHEWWYAQRDHDQNGLCEYGSTDGTRIAAAWESGMDNAVRFDKAIMTENGPQAWSLDQESVDLNAYLYADRSYLAQLAEAVGQTELAETLSAPLAEMQTRLQSTFWDEDSQYFYDYHVGSGDLVKVVGPEAWTMLWAGIATQAQAQAVVDMIMDTTRFNTPMPFPTLDASHPEFNPENGYWRGPVWLDQVYFAIEGMRRYGFTQEADQMVAKLLRQGEGILDKGQPIRENYDPRTGAGLNAQHFSWSAAHLLLMLD